MVRSQRRELYLFVIAPQPLPPPVLEPQPNLADLFAAINRNAAKVRSLKTTDANVAISASGMPAANVTAIIALERPRRFRMKATHMFLGLAADIGSNDELSWFWAKMFQPPALYFCRHDQIHQSQARRIMPLEPEFLVEAFGLTSIGLNPAEQHQGPTPIGNGRLRIDTIRQSPSGPLKKVTIVDGKSAIVLEQHLFDQQGRLVISAITSQHRRDPLSGAWLPRKIDLTSNVMGQKVAMSIQITNLEVNTLGPNDAELWQKPDYHDQGAPDIDLGNPQFHLSPGRFQMPPGAALPTTNPAQRRFGRRRFRRR